MPNPNTRIKRNSEYLFYLIMLFFYLILHAATSEIFNYKPDQSKLRNYIQEMQRVN